MKLRKIKNKYFKFFSLCFLFGFVLALIYYININKNELDILINNILYNKSLYMITNNMVNHLKILCVILCFSFVFIGFPIYIGLIISEGFSFFLRILILYKIYKVRGVIYSLIYYLINNGIYIFLLYLLSKKIINIIKLIYTYKVKQEQIKFEQLLVIINRTILIIIFIFINDLILYLYGFKLIKIFAFLLK